MAQQIHQERLVRMMNEHWMIYVVPVFICFLLFCASVFLFVIAGTAVYHSDWIWLASFIAASVFLLLSLHGFFLILLNESLSQIIITTRRVIRFHDSIPFSENMLEVTFEKMKTVEARKHGILRTLLNYGSLHFEQKSAVIDFVPHPNSAVRDIEQAMGMR